jgi:hypothetical protein
MASGYEVIMAEALTRLKAAPALAVVTAIRRAHRTLIPRDKSPAIHLIDGPDRPNKANNCGGRYCSFTISIFARSDAGVSALDTLRLAVMARMEAPWAAGIVLQPGAIIPDTEIGDEDPVRLDLEFEAQYDTAGRWALGLAA